MLFFTLFACLCYYRLVNGQKVKILVLILLHWFLSSLLDWKIPEVQIEIEMFICREITITKVYCYWIVKIKWLKIKWSKGEGLGASQFHWSDKKVKFYEFSICTRKGVKIETVTALNCMLMGHIASNEESVMLSHGNFQRVTHKELKEKLQSNAITAPSSGSNEHYSDSLQWAQSGELMLIKVESMQRIYMGRCVGIISPEITVGGFGRVRNGTKMP